MKFVSELKRSHYCGELTAAHEGQEVVLMGWVDSRRDHGGLVFVDLRDRAGCVQVVFDPNNDLTKASKDFRGEFVIALQGVVKLRPEGMANNKIQTGAIEIISSRCETLSRAETPPIQIDDNKVGESLRLKYRYLDLRSPRLQENIFTRSKVLQVVRNELIDQGFIEVETPILYKSTPEGARDYLVPSRVTQGSFYALPQSPQTLKQLLMIGGFDRYFQIARCFRDEDLRADRQPEFSQIDIEMSYVDMDDVMNSTEKLLRRIWQEIKGEEISEIQHMTYEEAMNRFGIDRPDLRIPWELKDLNDTFKDGCSFKVFDDVIGRGGAIKGLAVPGIGDYSRGQFDKLTNTARQMGAKGLVWIKSDEKGQLVSPISKFFSEEKLKEIFAATGGESRGAVLIVADDFNITCAALSQLRSNLALELGVIDDSCEKFLWVTDFPLMEFVPDEKRWVAVHHPFTAAKDEDTEALEKQQVEYYGKLKAKAYDLVCNGHEIGGGSIRIHNQDQQRAVFSALGMSDEEVKNQFGFFVEALSYGTPPHGGFAWGLDRLLMILQKTDAIRDVIAFPKTAKATCLMSDAPSVVAREQLLELGVRLVQSGDTNSKK